MSTTRRALLAGTAAVGVAAAIPGVQYAAWNMKDFARDGYRPDMPPAPEGEVAWSNWSGIQQATPTGISVPPTEEELAAAITGARHVRPVGSGHSFTALVPSEHLIVDASRFSGLISADATTGFATIGAGTRIRQAARELDTAGLALQNLPDVDVQTLAGSFSTSTHGTGRTLQPLHAHIEGFRLVTASGEVRDVTAGSDPDLFAAGRVSLGALGVITQYTLKCVPAFNLRRRVEVFTLDSVLERAMEFSEQHRNFEFYYFPFTGYAAAITHDIFEGEVTGRISDEDEDTLAGLKDLRDVFGWSPWLRRRVAAGNLPKGLIEESSDVSWKLLATARPTKFNEMEYHIPLEAGLDCLRAIIKAIESRKDLYFPMEIRITAPDDAWLSPFNDGPRMSIATHAAVDEPYDYFFSLLEPIHRAHGGRPHWGKLHSLQHDDLVALYPDFQRFCDLRKGLDPEGKFLNPHLAGLFGEDFNA
ncbi:MAG TPA: D-arabinono-1,4-lactone oxidase [Hyphomonas sp.]|nr:D-arabinono-1,4-lactone oxidase [Hyphomonas sp.]